MSCTQRAVWRKRGSSSPESLCEFRKFIAWLLTHLFKISPETSLSATTKDICFRYKSISTEENALITLKKGISHIYCKYQKPFWLLVLSVVVLLASIILQSQGYYDSLFAGILISIALFVIFYFKKSIAISIFSKITNLVIIT